MRFAAIALLFVTFGAAGASGSVTVQPSSIGFKEAIASCPAGTLGAISLTLGHVRIAEAANVTSDVDDASPSAQSVTFARGSAAATAIVNAPKNAVAAKHVSLASGKRVACVAPD